MQPSAFTVVTWNLEGRAGVAVAAVADVLGAARPDVVALQEVQRGQARRIGAALEMPAMRWALKHVPGHTWPEGLAVLTPHRLSVDGTFVLRRRPLWDWRRRIAIDAKIERDGEHLRIINAHLSPHDERGQRRREAATIVERGRDGPPAIVAGDLNDVPGGPAPATLSESGWQDAWMAAAPDDPGYTNWTPGERAGRPPTQRLDYVFAPAGWAVDAAAVLASPDQFDRFAALSDHLPLSVTLRTAAAT